MNAEKPYFYSIRKVRSVFVIFCGLEELHAVSIHPTEQAAEKRLRQILQGWGKEYSKQTKEYFKVARKHHSSVKVVKEARPCLCCSDWSTMDFGFGCCLCKECWAELCFGLIPGPELLSPKNHIPKGMGIRRVRNIKEADDC